MSKVATRLTRSFVMALVVSGITISSAVAETETRNPDGPNDNVGWQKPLMPGEHR